MKFTISLIFMIWAFFVTSNVVAASELEKTPFEIAHEVGGEGIVFTALSANESGLDRSNDFDDDRAWGALFREFNNGSLGTGVAVGDYDGDGLADIAVSFKMEGCRLYRNVGGNRFDDVSEEVGIDMEDSFFDKARSFFGSADDEQEPWTQGVSFADVDNDGWLDLYVCRFGAPNRLFINQGDGRFVEEAERRGLDTRDSSVMAAFCDYDQDGDLDVYLQTNLLDFSVQPDGRQDYLYRNVGDGFYEDASEALGDRPETQGHSAIWWDYDADGWFDLYVANDFAAPDILYRNNGDGTFEDVAAQVLPLVPYSAMGCDIADVDGDGRMDLFVADMAATNRFKDHRTMAPARYAPIDKLAARPIQRPRNCLFLATPSGFLREAAHSAGLDATDWTWSPRFEDLDNDGIEDLFVTNGMNREHHNLDLLGKVARARSPMARMAILKNSPVLKERDLLYRGSGELTFQEIGATAGIGEPGVSFGSASGDFDNDGDIDFVVTRYDAAPLLYRNDSKRGKSVILELEGEESNSFGLGSIVTLRTKTGTQTKQLSNARGYQSTSEAILHFGLGENESVEELIVNWPNGKSDVWQGVEAGFRYRLKEGSSQHSHFNGSTVERPLFRSTELELEEANPISIGLAGKRDDFLEPWSLKVEGQSLALGDLDSDGIVDIVLGGSSDLSVRSGVDFISSLVGRNRSVSEIAAGTGAVLMFDANEDGTPDLWVADTKRPPASGGARSAPELYLGNGDGGYNLDTSGLVGALPISADVIAAADFDKDGQIDIFVSGKVPQSRKVNSHRSVFLTREGERWEKSISIQLPDDGMIGVVTSAVCTDVDSDGWVDLVVTTLWRSPRFLRNQSGTHFEDVSDKWGFADTGSGWWSSVAAADLNSDGRTDFVLGNAGLNTIYEATDDEPVEMLFGKFGERNKEAFLEYEKVAGVRYPRRTRLDLIAVFPELRQQIVSSDKYAELSLEEIFTAGTLEGAEVFRATELRSGVLLSIAKGKYQFKPLPIIAQLGSTNAIALGDWNADTHVDIALAQNSSSAVSGPWYGGIGMLLEGNGQGGFEECAAGRSGYVVTGEGEGVASLDLDRNGWPDLLVTREAEGPILFLNKGVEGRSSLSIALSQNGSNPFGFGSEIRVKYADGSVQIRGIYSNNGSVAQSEASAFYGYTDALGIESIEVSWPDGELERIDLEKIESDSVIIEKGETTLKWLKKIQNKNTSL